MEITINRLLVIGSHSTPDTIDSVVTAIRGDLVTLEDGFALYEASVRNF